MTLGFNAPSDAGASGGNFLSEPGTYHCQVNGLKHENGKVIAELAVITGTVEGQGDKTCNISFWDGKLTDKDDGNFARVKQARLFIACDLMTPAQLGGQVNIELEKAEGRQLIIKLEKNKNDDRYLEVAGASVWHIDDPSAASYPKSAEALQLITDKKLRHDEAYFEPLKKRSSKSNQPAPTGGNGNLSQNDLDSLLT